VEARAESTVHAGAISVHPPIEPRFGIDDGECACGCDSSGYRCREHDRFHVRVGRFASMALFLIAPSSRGHLHDCFYASRPENASTFTGEYAESWAAYLRERGMIAVAVPA
jgi:hypothetical protein